MEERPVCAARSGHSVGLAIMSCPQRETQVSLASARSSSCHSRGVGGALSSTTLIQPASGLTVDLLTMLRGITWGETWSRYGTVE